MMKLDTTHLVPIGYCAIVDIHALKVIPHYRSSYITLSGRGSSFHENRQEVQVYPKSYALKDPESSLQHLEFALKHEGLSLAIIAALFAGLSSDVVTKFVAATPTGKYSRMIWFLYEFMTGTQLNIPDIKNTPYVNLLDPKKYFVANTIKSKRHAINNNLLGDSDFCPVVRKTDVLAKFDKKNLSEKAKKIMKSVDSSVLARATNFLYSKETKSSFGIEKIKPDVKRTAKFIELLEQAHDIERLDKILLLKLQNAIVEAQYKDDDYRDTQNYVGELTNLYEHKVHYISPKPEDIKALMAAFLSCESRLLSSQIHPVIIAAILSFGFVFLHPFEDGNGRIHRFIIHYILSKTGYTPATIIFPVSAVILKNIRRYDEELERFSKPLLHAVGEFDLNDNGVLTVKQATKLHYQYIDYTHYAEYLFECIESTIREDFKQELDFIVNYDRTKTAIQEIIDMPDIKIDRIIRCIAQNNGKLGAKARKNYFSELADEVIAAIEGAVKKSMMNI